ncbi:T9SS type A sorting domain-containing protein [uncultured Flavobacterium sp.]|uniref:T9SS type A sorting domain-containing protein n=1 Tax=uncultured Flavobacterium sp. TaxID=165435 RepID=UPI0030EB9825
MRTKLLLFVAILMANVSYCQVTDVITNLSSAGITNLAHKDNYIYFTAYSHKKVYKFDYTSSTPTVELVYQFNENPNFIYIMNNVLYVGVESPYKTYKIDLSLENAQPIELAAIAGPMAQINNDLYIGQYVAEKISKINLSTNVITDILTNYKPNFFALLNNELYFTSNTANSLYKYSCATNGVTTILTGLNYASGIVLNNDNLFICESSGNSISYYSLPNFQMTSNIQLPPSSWPNGITIVNDDLYFIQTVSGKISKVTLNSLNNIVLDTKSNVKTSETLTVYPNPSNGIINLKSELEIEKGQIYDLKGNLVSTLNIQNNQIDISNLNSATYLLSVNGKMTKIIKN